MKQLLTILFLLLGNFIYSQNLIQTYVDRCTGAVNVFTVPMNGSTVVAFYNRSRTFNSNDFQNGTLQAWLEETYLWWTSLNPCSTNQTQQTTVQTTVQQTTTQAATAATQAVASTAKAPTIDVPSPPTPSPTPAVSTPEVSTPVVEAPSTDTSVPTIDTGSSNTSNEPPVSTETTNQPTETSTGEAATTETTTEQTSTETSEPQTETTETEPTPSDSGDSDTQTSETEDSSTTQNENESDSESTSEVSEEETTTESESSESEESVEESSEESSEEQTEETSEEETTEEESTEEESSEEESESDESEEEESSEETSEESEEEKKDKKKKKKKTFAPPIISANLSSMQNIDGTFNQTMTIGASRSSLLGTETYAVNGMVWDNLKQFMLNASYSKVHINKEGRVDRVFSASIGGARMFTTTMGNNSLSWTFLGKKGAVKGIALTNSLISLEFNVVQGQIDQDAVLWAPAVTGFYTKSFNFDRFNVSPMLAVSSPFLTYDIFDRTEIWNKEIMLIIGSNFDYQLTKQFKVNLGVNTIHNTNPDVPLTWNFTIGSRFSF